MYRLNDFKFSTPDSRDYIIEDHKDELPEEFRLYIRGAVKDQGTEGSCSAQVAALLKEYHEYTERGIKGAFSVDFIYGQRLNKDIEGMSPRNTMKLLMEEGALPRRYWRNKYHRKGIPQEIKDIAKNFKIEGFARATDIEGLKRAIYLHGVGYMALPVYNTDTTCFWKKSEGNADMLGGHAISGIGWTKDGFILRNSWGASWGDNGETVIPYEDWNSIREVWVAIDAETADKFKRSGRLKREYR